MTTDEDKGGYVGRGGLKLEAAIEKLGVGPAIRGAQAIDIGASTGGFTECLLRHGAREVSAVEVGHGQLHARLRADPRVKNLEHINFKTVSLKVAPGPFDFFVMDVSFVASRTMLRPLAFRLRPGAEGVILVKPQFELAEGFVRHGEVKSEGLRHWALQRVKKKGEELGFKLLGSADSPVELESGTIEILTRWRFDGRAQKLIDPDAARAAKVRAARAKAAEVAPRGPKPEARTRSKPEPRTGARPEPRPEPTPEPRTAARPEPRGEGKRTPRPPKPPPYDQRKPKARPSRPAGDAFKRGERGDRNERPERNDRLPFEVPTLPRKPKGPGPKRR